jgi:hypothetical protein
MQEQRSVKSWVGRIVLCYFCVQSSVSAVFCLLTFPSIWYLHSESKVATETQVSRWQSLLWSYPVVDKVWRATQKRASFTNRNHRHNYRIPAVPVVVTTVISDWKQTVRRFHSRWQISLYWNAHVSTIQPANSPGAYEEWEIVFTWSTSFKSWIELVLFRVKSGDLKAERTKRGYLHGENSSVLFCVTNLCSYRWLPTFRSNILPPSSGTTYSCVCAHMYGPRSSPK